MECFLSWGKMFCWLPVNSFMYMIGREGENAGLRRFVDLWGKNKGGKLGMRREESSTQQLDSLKWTYEKFNQWLHTHISSDFVCKPDLQRVRQAQHPHAWKSPKGRAITFKFVWLSLAPSWPHNKIQLHQANRQKDKKWKSCQSIEIQMLLFVTGSAMLDVQQKEEWCFSYMLQEFRFRPKSIFS